MLLGCGKAGVSERLKDDANEWPHGEFSIGSSDYIEGE